MGRFPLVTSHTLTSSNCPVTMTTRQVGGDLAWYESVATKQRMCVPTSSSALSCHWKLYSTVPCPHWVGPSIRAPGGRGTRSGARPSPMTVFWSASVRLRETRACGLA